MIKPDKLIHVHYNKQNRLIFSLTYTLIFCILFVLIIGASIMCAKGVQFPNSGKDDFVPSHKGWYVSNDLLFGFGIALFVLTLILGFFLSFYLVYLFKASQSLYFNTKRYKNNVKKYEGVNLTRYSKKQLKWLYKLKYINKNDYLVTKANLKKKK